MASSPKLVLKGFNELDAKLARLGDPKKTRRITKKGTTAGATVIAKGVRRAWPRLSGFSAKSVEKKIFPGRVGFTAIIGIDANAQQGRHIPANIDHLVEFGFQRPDGTTVPAKAPLKTGFEATRDAALAAYTSKTTAELEKEAMKK